MIAQGQNRLLQKGAIDLLILAVIAIIAIAIPFTSRLVQQSQEIRKQATEVIYCPNGTCGAGENCTNCPQDCGACPVATATPLPTSIPAGERPAGCPVGCCGGICGGCPSGQSCSIPNGACTGAGSLMSCNPQGYGNHKECRNHMCVEVPGAGTDLCTDNAKCADTQPKVCTAGACCGNGVRCNSDGTACNVTDDQARSCGSGQACWPGNCCKEGFKCNSAGTACDVAASICTSVLPTATAAPSQTCTSGATRCNGNTNETCVSRYGVTYWDGKACPEDNKCVMQGGAAVCVAENCWFDDLATCQSACSNCSKCGDGSYECLSRETRCTYPSGAIGDEFCSDDKILNTCIAGSYYPSWEETNCPDNYICSNDKCVPSTVCSPGVSRCNGNILETCVSRYGQKYWDGKECPSGCANNDCLACYSDEWANYEAGVCQCNGSAGTREVTQRNRCNDSRTITENCSFECTGSAPTGNPELGKCISDCGSNYVCIADCYRTYPVTIPTLIPSEASCLGENDKCTGFPWSKGCCSGLECRGDQCQVPMQCSTRGGWCNTPGTLPCCDGLSCQALHCFEAPGVPTPLPTQTPTECINSCLMASPGDYTCWQQCGLEPPETPISCPNTGAICLSSSNCCSGTECRLFRCQEPIGPIPTLTPEQCLDSCLLGSPGDYTCWQQCGLSRPETPLVCPNNGALCLSSSNCCSGLECRLFTCQEPALPLPDLTPEQCLDSCLLGSPGDYTCWQQCGLSRPETPLVCPNNGAICLTENNCCPGLSCNLFRCQTPFVPVPIPPQTPEECLSNCLMASPGDYTCWQQCGLERPETPVSCPNTGALCVTSDTCCSGLQCLNLKCQVPADSPTCRTEGQSCGVPDRCCHHDLGDLVCDQGQCKSRDSVPLTYFCSLVGQSSCYGGYSFGLGATCTPCGTGQTCNHSTGLCEEVIVFPTPTPDPSDALGNCLAGCPEMDIFCSDRCITNFGPKPTGVAFTEPQPVIRKWCSGPHTLAESKLYPLPPSMTFTLCPNGGECKMGACQPGPGGGGVN